MDELRGDFAGGLIAITVRDGDVQQAASGIADVEGTPLQMATPMRTGQLSETFVAVLVLQLVDEGLVDLSDPLGTHLPGVDAFGDIPIGDLLAHRSGIRDHLLEFNVHFGNPNRYSTAEVLEVAAGLGRDTPGTFNPSATADYFLLGLMIDHLDRDLNEALERRISQPLGLESTWFETETHPAPGDLPSDWATAFNDGEQRDLTGWVSAVGAAGSIITTADDLLRFTQAVTGGELLTTASRDHMFDTSDDGYGLGIRSVFFRGGDVAVGNQGSLGAYSAAFYTSPDSSQVNIVLANNDVLAAGRLATQIGSG